MTDPQGWRIRAQGDRCLIVSFGDIIDPDVGGRCLAFSSLVRDARLPGVTDVVPSFAAVAVHYAPLADGSGPDYELLAERLRELLARGTAGTRIQGREIEIPVCYGGEHGPDLLAVAQAQGITPEQVIAQHSDAPCRVYMLGFAPGHPYIGLHGDALNVPRRNDPRTEVPAGSVAVANRQTVIYPSRLPGGWNILGATPLVMFDARRDPPALLAPGDTVRFVPIPEARYRLLKAEQNR